MKRNGTQSTNRNGSLLRSESRSATNTTSSDFVLQWGNRKRLRCMKVQAKDNEPSGSGQGQRATAWVDHRVVRSDRYNSSTKDPSSNQLIRGKSNGGGNGYMNLRQSPASPSHKIFRNSESSIAMRGNGIRRFASPDTGDKKRGLAANHNVSHHSRGGGSGFSETAHDGKKCGSSSGGGGDTIAAMWPPKFVISLTNKEKEEDFMVLKGSKLPQRPKKRAKFIQKTLNLVSPGAWLCDLTLERYEVREKKVTKKRARGLKGMGNCMDSESE